MARPSKYNWEAIQVAYEKGFEKDEIVKKFKVSKAILTNKINSEKWSIKCDVNDDISEFNAKVNEIAQNYTKHPEVEDLFIEKINTQALDNELIQNNRKLAKMLQGVIVSERQKINISNIKQVSSTLRDIESISNPQSSKVEVNNTNSQQNNTPTQIVIKRDN